MSPLVTAIGGATSAQPGHIPADDASHETAVQRRADAMALTQQLRFLRRSWLLLPVELLWVALALRAGQSVSWVASAYAIRLASHLCAVRVANWVEPLVQQDPARGLQRTRLLYWLLGLWLCLVLPGLLINDDDTVRLLAMLLAAHYAGVVVVAAAGDQRTHWVTTAPFLSLMIIGWLLRGGALGWLIAGMSVFVVPMTVVALRNQRQGIERLVRLSMEQERLAARLAAERDRVQQAVDARTRFFAAASHDLRQPLHALSINVTTLELLARRAGDPQLAALSTAIGRALAQSQGLLDALLDISRLDAGAVPLRIAEVDLRELLTLLHAEYRGLAADLGLDFVLRLPDGPVRARSDADQLQRILHNLLDNAFKFTAQGRVELALSVQGGAAEEGRDGTACITVSDTGCGIAAGDREKVFEEFFQVGNPARDRSRGLGLGLAIVRRTAALIGAEVRLREPLPGEVGSSFELRLAGTQPAVAPNAAVPVSTIAAIAAPQPKGAERPAAVVPTAPKVEVSPPSPSRALTVLVVDDEPDVLRAVEGLLGAIGWRVLSAATPDGALALAGDAAHAFDVALVDHRLPGCTGVELALQLRRRRPALPVLVLTGDVAVQWQVRRHGLALLHKPLDGSRLAAALAAEVAAHTRRAEMAARYRTQEGGPTMNLLDAVHGRRSIRSYLDRMPPREMVEELIWQAAQVPRPPISDDACWAFQVLAGRERLDDFGRRAKAFAAAAQSPGAPRGWASQGDFEVFWGAPLAVVLCARRGHPEAPFDCCRAGQNLMLLAHARGLGSCWVGSPLPWLQSDEGRRSAELPDGLDAVAVIVLGHPAEALPPRTTACPPIRWSADAADFSPAAPPDPANSAAPGTAPRHRPA